MMVRSGIVWMTALVLISAASGCCITRFHGVGPCGGGHCGTLPSCGDCGDCHDCGQFVLGAYAHKAITCGSGCGEIYVDEWISDPPECCDPCDNHGHWIGRRCGRFTPVRSLLRLFHGYRYYDHGCFDSCLDCNGTPIVHDGTVLHHGPVETWGEPGLIFDERSEVIEPPRPQSTQRGAAPPRSYYTPGSTAGRP